MEFELPYDRSRQETKEMEIKISQLKEIKQKQKLNHLRNYVITLPGLTWAFILQLNLNFLLLSGYDQKTFDNSFVSFRFDLISVQLRIKLQLIIHVPSLHFIIVDFPPGPQRLRHYTQQISFHSFMLWNYIRCISRDY